MKIESRIGWKVKLARDARGPAKNYVSFPVVLAKSTTVPQNYCLEYFMILVPRICHS